MYLLSTIFISSKLVWFGILWVQAPKIDIKGISSTQFILMNTNILLKMKISVVNLFRASTLFNSTVTRYLHCDECMSLLNFTWNTKKLYNSLYISNQYALIDTVCVLIFQALLSFTSVVVQYLVPCAIVTFCYSSICRYLSNRPILANNLRYIILWLWNLIVKRFSNEPFWRESK